MLNLQLYDNVLYNQYMYA